MLRVWRRHRSRVVPAVQRDGESKRSHSALWLPENEPVAEAESIVGRVTTQHSNESEDEETDDEDDSVDPKQSAQEREEGSFARSARLTCPTRSQTL